MSEVWILFSILAAITWSVVNIVDKYVVTKWVDKPIVPVLIMGITGLVIGLGIIIPRGLSELSYINVIWTLVAGIFYTLMNIFYFKAAKIEEISRIVPLFSLVPLFVAILSAIFLGEIFTITTYLGIAFLVIGAILISSRKLTKISVGKAFWFTILGILSISINYVITKYLLSFADFWTIFSYTRMGAFLAVIPIFFLNYHDLVHIVKVHGKKVVGVMTANEALNVLAVLFITIAAATGFITLVNALASIQPFFVLVFAVVLSIWYPKILREEITKSTVFIKLVAIILLFIGVLLIS